MTISNKYNAGFCVLTIKVVGYAHVIWNTKKLVENVFTINPWKLIVEKSGSIHMRDPVGGRRDSGLERGRERRIQSGVTNQI